jgi:acyl transferase domain-containing protein
MDARAPVIGTTMDARGWPSLVGSGRALFLDAETPEDLLARLDSAVATSEEHPDPRRTCRLAIIDPSERRMDLARRVVAKGRPWRGRDDVWFSSRPMLSAPDVGVAFLFPGLEADFDPRLADVAAWMGEPEPDLSTTSLGRRAASTLAEGRLLERALLRLGIRPDAAAGHSVGEWNAMLAGGILSAHDLDALLEGTRLDDLEVPEVDYAVVGCTAEDAVEIIAGWPALCISHENSTNQTVVCGPPAEIAAVSEEFRKKAVICRLLPFRSGFHTPKLEPFLGPFADGVPRLPIRPMSLPVWSGTTGDRFPDEPEAVRDLCLRHLLEPVRFRQTVLSLYEAGTRAFVQVGCGQLASLVSDTLRGQDHLIVAAGSTQRPGLDQLLRVVAGLWVEGFQPKPVSGHLPSDTVPVAPASAGTSDTRSLDAIGRLEQVRVPTRAAAELDRLVIDLTGAVEMVALAAERRRVLPSSGLVAAPSGAGRMQQRLEVSVESMPYLLDHCFARQRRGWPHTDDRRPVMPATTTAAHMAQVVEDTLAGQVVTGLDDLRFERWLLAAPPHEVTIDLQRRDTHATEVEFVGYASGTVLTAADFPSPEASAELLPHDPTERRPSFEAVDLYADQWMLHGPTFQTVTRLVAMGERTARAELTAPDVPGALLDGASQVLAAWLVERHPDHWLAFPAGVDRIRFYAPLPAAGSVVDCAVRVTSMGDRMVVADLVLSQDGRVVATVSGWRSRRFETAGRLDAVYRFPERHLLTEEQPGGWWLLNDPWTTVASRELYLHRYLNAVERHDYEACPAWERRAWSLRVIASKDAVRGWLWARDGASPLYPAELTVRAGADGECVVTGPGLDQAGVRVAVDTVADVGVALVGASERIRVRDAPSADPSVGVSESLAVTQVISAAGQQYHVDIQSIEGAVV